MKYLLLLAAIATTVVCRPAFADDAPNPTNELKAIVAQVSTDIRSGKRSETDLSDDLKRFDSFLSEHKGEKTDIVAQALYLKATIYGQVLGDTDKADSLMKQLTNDFSGTKFVATIQEQQAQEAKVKQVQDALAVGTQFPDFNEKDVNGKPLSIANYKGKIVMIDFWATWCGPCRGEIPNVVATYQKYHNKGFEIIGVSLDSDQQKVLDFTKENNMPWPQFFDGQEWANKLAVKYGIESIPMTYLLDGNGKIIGKDLRGAELTDTVAAAVAK